MCLKVEKIDLKRVAILFGFLVCLQLVGACAAIRYYPECPFNEFIKAKPFAATVEDWDVHGRWFIKSEIDLYLRKDKTGKRLMVVIYPATKADIDFAYSLKQGGAYIFPNDYKDYVGYYETNAVK